MNESINELINKSMNKLIKQASKQLIYQSSKQQSHEVTGRVVFHIFNHGRVVPCHQINIINQ
jgi:hypothetical protein